MPLKPGYNLVTEPVGETTGEYGALEFFRVAAADEDLPPRLTVTNLAELLYYVAPDNRAAAISQLRNILRNSGSIGQFTAIQFVIDGRLSPADRFQIQMDRQGDTIVLDVGELFVAEPEMLSANHAHAQK
jgi:hypothetical protein